MFGNHSVSNIDLAIHIDTVFSLKMIQFLSRLSSMYS